MGSVIKGDLQVCPLYLHTGYMTQFFQRNSCPLNILTRILVQHFILTQLVDLPLSLFGVLRNFVRWPSFHLRGHIPV